MLYLVAPSSLPCQHHFIWVLHSQRGELHGGWSSGGMSQPCTIPLSVYISCDEDDVRCRHFPFPLHYFFTCWMTRALWRGSKWQAARTSLPQEPQDSLCSRTGEHKYVFIYLCWEYFQFLQKQHVKIETVSHSEIHLTVHWRLEALSRDEDGCPEIKTKNRHTGPRMLEELYWLQKGPGWQTSLS